MPSAPIRVASIPSAHPYVRHLTDPQRSGHVVRLPDPRPAVIGAPADQWWPPRMLDLQWVGEHRDEFDMVHLHFGFDAASPAHLARWTARLRELHIPLVMTVHDLVNPHFPDPAAHLAQLEVLIPAADALITLTHRAASTIRTRWGRTASVIPHPHVVPVPRMAEIPLERPPFVVGVHAKSLRANIDPLPVLQALMPALPSMPGVMLRLDAHPDLFAVANADPRAEALRHWIDSLQGHPQVMVAVHPRYEDAELWNYLQSIDLCILPYRFGTHSGWLEACVDLGTAALVPATGCYQDQHGHPAYGPGAQGLVEAVRAVVADPGAARPTPPDRLEQRRSIALAHEQVYRRVLRHQGPSLNHLLNHVAEVGPA